MTAAAPPPSEPIPVWPDGKAPDALRTIGEVGEALGLRQHVLRYWEDQFPMLKPLKRSGGRRYYRPEDIALVRRIDQLVHREGYTLRGARSVLEGEGRAATSARPAGKPAPDPAGLPTAAPVITERPPATELSLRLRRMRARLIEALEG
ncbi:MerR family transcriptional regulator [Novosphingobium sp.]|uniref:MerR family transcriptional regulator n=1 Tax=Novosphingobium sp. TaxID=1874826 RepID=UPI002618192F|nr:MerR family transcriptional regulator [Novosphingobium sp.]